MRSWADRTDTSLITTARGTVVENLFLIMTQPSEYIFDGVLMSDVSREDCRSRSLNTRSICAWWFRHFDRQQADFALEIISSKKASFAIQRARIKIQDSRLQREQEKGQIIEWKLSALESAMRGLPPETRTWHFSAKEILWVRAYFKLRRRSSFTSFVENGIEASTSSTWHLGRYKSLKALSKLIFRWRRVFQRNNLPVPSRLFRASPAPQLFALERHSIRLRILTQKNCLK